MRDNGYQKQTFYTGTTTIRMESIEAMNYKDLWLKYDMDWRRIKKVAIPVVHRTKTWKSEHVGYIMPDDLLLYKRKDEEATRVQDDSGYRDTWATVWEI